MTGTAIFKRSGLFLLDVIEIYTPTITFVVMFVVFILQVFYRYFLNSPLTWPPEVISTTFIWTTVLGACYAQRKSEHVMFTLLYDRSSAKIQLATRLIGNGLIAITFIIALKPAIDYVQFMEFKSSTVLKIPFSYSFAPFVIFLVLIIGRMLYAIFLDVKRIINKEIEKDAGLTLEEAVSEMILGEDSK